jgi:transcriptional regulator with XRE-family HTH domain
VAETTSKPFSEALRELLLERDYATQTGKPNWTAFAEQLDGIHYETLRKTVAGDRQPTLKLIEHCARALAITPDYFAEYRLALAQRELDIDAVGFQQALRNLQTWTAARKAS